eukprot:scaffold285993_cov17-Tisochrysis_lutea.AAC.1
MQAISVRVVQPHAHSTLLNTTPPRLTGIWVLLIWLLEGDESGAGGCPNTGAPVLNLVIIGFDLQP